MEIHESQVGKIVQHKLTKEKVIISFVRSDGETKTVRIRRFDKLRNEYNEIEVDARELEVIKRKIKK